MGFGLVRTTHSVFRGRKRPPEVCSVPLPLRIRFVSTGTSPCTRYFGGDDGIRTHDPLLAGQVLSQLSYTPVTTVLCFSLPFWFIERTVSCSLNNVSIELSSRTVSRKVFSPLQSLTSVFGMGTGGPSAFITLTIRFQEALLLEN